MPRADFRCQECGHTFNRLVFKGDDDAQGAVCPLCGEGAVKTQPLAQSLFNGMAAFSSLNEDVN